MGRETVGLSTVGLETVGLSTAGRETAGREIVELEKRKLIWERGGQRILGDNGFPGDLVGEI